jgi:hypothetical protein
MRSTWCSGLLLLAACGGGEGADVYAEVAPGAQYTCATTDKGRAVCWGFNGAGQVGGETQLDTVRFPRFVLTGPVQLDEVSSGVVLTCADPVGSGALCWGSGQPGIKATMEHVDLASISVGIFACAVTPGGEVPCWNAPGAEPVFTPGVVGATEVAVGLRDACAVGPGLGILCWSSLGGAVTILPTTAGATFRGITAGGLHGCAIGADSVARCWGRNIEGQLGDGTSSGTTTPQVVLQGDRPTATEKFVTVSASGNRTCGVTTSDRGFCWGQNLPRYPLRTPGFEFWRDLRPGWAHTCGFAKDDDGLYCWGENEAGQTGTGSVPFVFVPERVIEP